MKCHTCGHDKPASEYAPSAALWPDRPHHCKPCERTRSQLRRHGITAADREIVANHQGGCRICGHADPGHKGWVIDHDHTCCGPDRSCPKCRRGILCFYCNALLGNAFDRPEILAAAVEYLNAPRTCTWHMPLACAPSICGNGIPA